MLGRTEKGIVVVRGMAKDDLEEMSTDISVRRCFFLVVGWREE